MLSDVHPKPMSTQIRCPPKSDVHPNPMSTQIRCPPKGRSIALYYLDQAVPVGVGPERRYQGWSAGRRPCVGDRKYPVSAGPRRVAEGHDPLTGRPLGPSGPCRPGNRPVTNRARARVEPSRVELISDEPPTRRPDFPVPVSAVSAVSEQCQRRVSGLFDPPTGIPLARGSLSSHICL